MDKVPPKSVCEFSVKKPGIPLRSQPNPGIIKDSVHKGADGFAGPRGKGNKSRKEYKYELFP